MANPVVHFEIHGKDATKLGAFYSSLFGWKVDANNPMAYGLVDTNSGGNGIAGGIAGDERSWVTFYVSAPDVQEALAKAVSLGAKVVMPVEVIPGMVTMAQFSDPEGNVVGIVADQPPPA